MSNDIRIKNGLSINLKGAPENIVKKASFPKSVSINPSNFHLITPKMAVKVGDKAVSYTHLTLPTILLV